MVKVITYGTYDLLHYGHIRLLERAKALGDYLIVGVTADDFDKVRGKINVKQTLMERIEAVRATGIADEIIVEEYEGQKIDDIRRYDVDIFTVGSDWVGKFDYLNEYCKVIYLDRTEGISSSEIRAKGRSIKFGIVGETKVLNKYKNECKFVNGVEVEGICSANENFKEESLKEGIFFTNSYSELLKKVDAVYIISNPKYHYEQIKQAICCGKHVLCESPITQSKEQTNELFDLANKNNVILMESIKTAYSTAYSRLLLLAKDGRIGKVVSVDATCTSLEKHDFDDNYSWNSICAWGPTAMLPIFQILGIKYKRKLIQSYFDKSKKNYDMFTKVDYVYEGAVASLKVGKGVKSEGELIVSGTKGYIYVPAPWWKTDYFEIRYENPQENRRYFYQLDGEGIRYTIVNFIKSIERGKESKYIDKDISIEISKIIEDFVSGTDVISI